MQHLDRDSALDGFIESFIDRAHPTCAQLAEDSVRTNPLWHRWLLATDKVLAFRRLGRSRTLSRGFIMVGHQCQVMHAPRHAVRAPLDGWCSATTRIDSFLCCGAHVLPLPVSSQSARKQCASSARAVYESRVIRTVRELRIPSDVMCCSGRNRGTLFRCSVTWSETCIVPGDRNALALASSSYRWTCNGRIGSDVWKLSDRTATR